MEELNQIVQSMIDAGETESNIQLVIESYKPQEELAKTNDSANADPAVESNQNSMDSVLANGSLESQNNALDLVIDEIAEPSDYYKEKSAELNQNIAEIEKQLNAYEEKGGAIDPRDAKVLQDYKNELATLDPAKIGIKERLLNAVSNVPVQLEAAWEGSKAGFVDWMSVAAGDDAADFLTGGMDNGPIVLIDPETDEEVAFKTNPDRFKELNSAQAAGEPIKAIYQNTKKEIGEAADEYIIEKFKEVSILNSSLKETGSIIGGINNADPQEFVGGVISAVGSLLTTAVPAALTRGASLFPQIVAPMYTDFNETKAKSKYPDSADPLSELVNNDETEVAIPIALGGISMALEAVGLKGISKQISKSTGKLAPFAKLLLTNNKEGLTEVGQYGVENINKSLAEGNSLAEATLDGLKSMATLDALENYAQGFVGAGIISTPSTITKAINGQPGSLKFINKTITELGALQQARGKNKNKAFRTAVDLEIAETEAKLKEHFTENYYVSKAFNKEQQGKIISILDQKEKNAKTIEELKVSFDAGELSNSQYGGAKSALVKNNNKLSSEIDIIKNEVTEKLNLESFDKDVANVGKALKSIDQKVDETIILEDDKDGLASDKFKDFLQKNIPSDIAKLTSKKQNEWIENNKNNLGGFTQTKEGKEVLIINKAASLKSGFVTTGQHEFLHKLLKFSMDSDPSLITNAGKILLDGVKSNKNDKQGIEFNTRVAQYQSDLDKNLINTKTFYEEVLPLYSEAITRGDISLDRSSIQKIKDFFRQIFQDKGLTKLDFNTDQGIINFIVDYNKSFSRGEFKGKLKDLAKGDKNAVSNKDNSKTTFRASKTLTPEQSASLSKQVVEIKRLSKENAEIAAKYNKEPIKGTKQTRLENQVREGIKPLVEKIVSNRTKALYDPIAPDAKKAVTRQEFQDSMRSDIEAMILNEYDETKQDLEKFTVSRAYLRANDLAKRLGIESQEEGGIKKDVDAAKDIVSTKDTQSVDRSGSVERGQATFDELDIVDDKLISEIESEVSKELKMRASKGTLSEMVSVKRGRETYFVSWLENLVDKTLFKKILKKWGAIGEAKGVTVIPPGYIDFLNSKEVFNVVTKALPIKTIKKSYGKLFKIEKVGREKSDQGNPIFRIAPTDKKTFLQYFLDGKKTTILERQKQLAREIITPVTKEVVANYATPENLSSLKEIQKLAPEQSSDIKADIIIDAQIRNLESKLDRYKGEQKSFDIIQFSKISKEDNTIILDTLENLKSKTKVRNPRYDVLNGLIKELKTGKINTYKELVKLVMNSKDIKSVLSLNSIRKYRSEILVELINSFEHKDKSKFILNAFASFDKTFKDQWYTIGFNYASKNLKEKLKAESSINGQRKIIKDFLFFTSRSIRTQGINGITTNRDVFNEFIGRELGKKLGFKVIKEGSRTYIVMSNGKAWVKLSGFTQIDDIKKDFKSNIPKVSKEAYIGREYIINNIIEAKEKGDVNEIIGRLTLDFVDQRALIRKLSIPGFEEKNISGKSILEHETEASTIFKTLVAFAKGEVSEKSVRSFLDGAKINLISEKFDDALKATGLEGKARYNNKDVKKKFMGNINTFEEVSRSYIPPVTTVIDLNAIKFSLTGTADIKFRDAVGGIQSSYFEVRGVDYTAELYDFSSLEEAAMIDPELMIKEMQEVSGEQKIIAKEYKYLAFDQDGDSEIISTYDAEWNGKRYVYPESDTKQSLAVFGSLVNYFLGEIKKGNLKGISFAAAEPSRQRLYNSIAERFSRQIGWNYSVVERPQKKGGHLYFIAKPKNMQFSKSINKEFNNIIEGATGIKSAKTMSGARSKVLGQNKGKFKFFIPPSADDFAGLVSRLLGKGKEGDANAAWFKENLFDPFAKGIRNYESYKEQSIAIVRALKKSIRNIPNGLKKVNDTGFTNEQAVRVYMWVKNGYDIKDLSEADQKELVKVIEDNKALKDFADELDESFGGYPEPDNEWLGGSIVTDMLNMVNTSKRAEFLQSWQENSDIVFSKENLNKLRAAYGDNYVEALEDMLYRMKTGRNRPSGSNKLTNQFMNWVNNSVGTIMFFNTRSALLQTLSIANFINWKENNPAKAAMAFANQKQFWSDFAMLFNSDFLKQRRGGLKNDVNADELASAAETAANKPKAVLSSILKAGFLPTQIADSFAIAMGGASFIRNRINKYVSEGMDVKAAEEQSFLDFQEIAEETQQSSRPDRVSQQQASPLGRIVLAFANTPMQYMRLTKKAYLDLKNGRGDAKTNISKIVYYTVLQNVIFGALQSALFASLFEDEEDEELKNKEIRIANSMLDSILRGLGIYGAIASTGKNIILEVKKQADKPRPDFTQVAIKSLDLSPPLSSKLRKMISTGRAFSYKNVRDKMTKSYGLENPAYYAIAQSVSAVTNLPIDRAIKKADNIRVAMDNDTKLWQSIALSLGYSQWDLGLMETAKSKKDKRKVLKRRKLIRKKLKRQIKK